jgi:hypothetical protein
MNRTGEGIIPIILVDTLRMAAILMKIGVLPFLPAVTQTLGGGAQGHPPLFRYGNVGGRPHGAVLAGSGAGLLSDSIIPLPPAGYFC